MPLSCQLQKEIPVEQTVYESYRQRNEIEIMFDNYKNYLDADVSYMQNRYVLEGWLFANFIAMVTYYNIVCKITIGRTPNQILAKGHHRTLESNL